MKKLIVAAVISTTFSSLHADTIFVDSSRPVPGDGLSWSTAFPDLQSAISIATADDEIWVAEGTYKPGTDRTDSFILKTGVEIYGGFPPGGSAIELRNPDPFSNSTILSGDIGTADLVDDNCFHVVAGTGTSSSAILDGFTVRDGNANGDSGDRNHVGGGITCDPSGTPAFRNLLVTRNLTNTVGGGFYANAASPSFHNVTFLENRTTATGSSVTGEGGAVYLNNSNPTFSGGAFLGNVSLNSGAALSLHSSSATFTNVIFAGNAALNGGHGGGIYNASSTASTGTNCSFVSNHASNGGGISGSGIVLKNSILWNNSASSNPQFNGSPAGGSSRNLIEDSSTNGGSIISASNPQFVLTPISGDGDWSTWDDNHYGDLRLLAGSAAIDSGSNAVSVVSEDVEGNPRPVDGDLNGAADIDLGPFEFQPSFTIPADGEIHRWTFDGGAMDSVGNLDLALNGGARIRDGHLILDGLDDFAVTASSTEITIGERTLVAWIDPANLTQRSGGILSIVRTTNGSDVFDSIVYAEKTPFQWMNGSNSLARTIDNNGGAAETVQGTDQVMIAISYGPGNTVNVYRNGQQYNTQTLNKGSLIQYGVGETQFHIGQRHPNTSSPSRFFAGRIDEARVYAKALSAGEMLAVFQAGPTPDTPEDELANGLINLSKGALARQSATEAVNLPDRSDAGIAIDGRITSGNRIVAIPGTPGASPWVEVELTEESLIEKVEIINLTNNLNSGCCRSRLRDITIELRDASGSVLASSPLLNPENAGYSFPNGPLSLEHQFSSETPARFVRVIRTPDPDLSGTRGQSAVLEHEIEYLEPSEIRIIGRLATPPLPAAPFTASYDSRRADPNPASQLWFDTEIVEGSDGSPPDGRINPPANVGIVIEGTEVAWQIADQLTAGSVNNPWNRNLLESDELRQLHDFGWVYSFTVKAEDVDSSDDVAGSTGWGFSAGRNPGWDIGANAFARIEFAIGKTGGDNRFFVRPGGQTPVTLDPETGDDYHTITAIGQPRSSTYEWFINGVSQGSLDFADFDVGGLTENNLSFGSGSSNALDRVANWKQVRLEAIPAAADLPTEGLLFYLPFEPGSSGAKTLEERSQAPGSKPAVTEASRPGTSSIVGASGSGLYFPGGPVLNDSAYLSSPESIAQLGGLDTGTISVWVKPINDDGTVLGFTNSSGFRGPFIEFFPGDPGNRPSIVYGYFNNVGYTSLVTPFPHPDVHDGRWHHIAVTVSTTESRLYVDGNLEFRSTSTNRPRFTGDVLTIDSFTIGTRLSSPQLADEVRFNGGIDEVAVWNRALSESEVTSVFQRGYFAAPISLDLDQDELNALEESALGTSEGTSDSDGDGIPDGEETAIGTDPLRSDSDGDGVSDNEELANGTDPLLADTDGDGFGDGNEGRQGQLSNEGLDPSEPTVQLRFLIDGVGENLRVETSDSLTVFDPLPSAKILHLGDGHHIALFTPPAGHRFFRILSDNGTLTNALDAGSFPARAILDTDVDGLLDPDEINLGTDPLDADSDGDDIEDFTEVLLGSDPLDGSSVPNLLDTDGDGLTDKQEATLGTNPNLVSSDGDPFSDLEEINAGSNPNSAASVPSSAILRATLFNRAANGDITLEFRIVGSGSNIRLETSEALDGFTEFPGATLTDLGGGSYRLEATPPPDHRFFRVAVDSGGGTVTTRTANFDLGEGSTITRTEGELISPTVDLGGNYTGTLAFELSGTRSDGSALSTVLGKVEVDGATSASIPLTLFNDLSIGRPGNYKLTLLGGPGIVAGLDAVLTIVVNEDDSRWIGTLQTRGEIFDIQIETLQNGTESRQNLEAARPSSLLPEGRFPLTASFGEEVFSASVEHILLSRTGSEVTSRPGSIRFLQLSATDALLDEEITPTTINGRFDLTLAPPGGEEVVTSGLMRLLKEPPAPHSSELDLTPSAP